MNLYKFEFNNYYKGRKTFYVVSKSEDSAYSLLKEKHSSYILDEETFIDNVDECDLTTENII